MASSFAFNSSSENCTPAFKEHKLIAEKKTLYFSSDNSVYYNEEFSLTELKHALEKSRDTSPGLDLIHCQILKHLPDESLSVLLTIFNYIWQTQHFPTIWKTALIIPIQNPGKIASDPKSYRPISLTSCICKTFERMVNRRLVWYIERNQILTDNSQCNSKISNINELDNLLTSKLCLSRIMHFNYCSVMHNKHIYTFI